MIVAAVEVIGSYVIGTAWKEVLYLLLFIGILVVRPAGLFGQRGAEAYREAEENVSRGSLRRAHELYRKALSEEPQNSTIRISFALLSASLGLWKEAIAACRQVLLYALGDCRHELVERGRSSAEQPLAIVVPLTVSRALARSPQEKDDIAFVLTRFH